jgi:Flp pilus assembly protein TadD
VSSWFQARHWQNSVSLFSHAVRVTPPNAVARLNLGAALENQGDYGEAVEQYLEALRINPNYDTAHFNLGVNYRRVGDLDRAIWHIQQALRLYPDFPGARQELDYCLWLKTRR